MTTDSKIKAASFILNASKWYVGFNVIFGLGVTLASIPMHLHRELTGRAFYITSVGLVSVLSTFFVFLILSRLSCAFKFWMASNRSEIFSALSNAPRYLYISFALEVLDWILRLVSPIAQKSPNELFAHMPEHRHLFDMIKVLLEARSLFLYWPSGIQFILIALIFSILMEKKASPPLSPLK